MKYKGIRVFNTSFGTFGFGARAYGWWICCPEHLQAKWLSHEAKHCEDIKKNPFKYAWGWFLNWKFRLYVESRAYQVSHQYNSAYVALKLNKHYNIPHEIKPHHVIQLMKLCKDKPFEEVEVAIQTIVEEWEVWEKR